MRPSAPATAPKMLYAASDICSDAVRILRWCGGAVVLGLGGRASGRVASTGPAVLSRDSGSSRGEGLGPVFMHWPCARNAKSAGLAWHHDGVTQARVHVRARAYGKEEMNRLLARRKEGRVRAGCRG